MTMVSCLSCGHTQEHSFDLDECSEMRTPSEQHERTAAGTFLITGFPRTDVTVEVKLLTSKDEKEISQGIEKRQQHNLPVTPLIEQMRGFVVSVNGNSSGPYIDSFLENLPAMDARHLRKSYNSVIPTIDLTHEYSCTACHFTLKMEVPLTADFFWPR